METGNNIQNLASESDEPKIKKRSAWAAFFLTMLCPGLGHFYCGEIKRGFFLFLVSAIIYAIFAVLLKFTPNISLIVLSAIIGLPLTIYIFIDAILMAKKRANYVLKDFNKGSYYLYIFLVSAYYIGPIDSYLLPESYTTPTGSMMNTIIPGDLFLGNDMAYGIRNPFTGKYVYSLSKPQRGDVVEFKNRNIDRDERTGEIIKYLKRILALPGDTLIIRYGLVYINGDKFDFPGTAILESNTRPKATYKDKLIFPKGSGWNQDHYGPLTIPKEGQIVELDTGNIHLWRKLIEDEGNKLEVTWSKIMINDREQYKYVIKKNYYFMIGDNWHESFDSRYWGFVAEDDIIAKITMIYLSIDINKPLNRTDKLLSFIRWDRIGTIIK